MPATRPRRVLSAGGAAELARLAADDAGTRAAGVAIAVVDPWGRTLHVTRTADSLPGSDTVAVDTARTAATFVRPSGEIEAQINGGRLGALALRGATALRGGVPVVFAGEVVGAVGISGDDPGTDERIAGATAGAVTAGAVLTVPVVTAAGAQLVVRAALAEADRHGVAPVVAVVDSGGVLVALGRPDSAQVASVGVATDKARTAALFRRASRELEDAAASGRPSILHLSGAVALQGGVPLVVDGQVAGAVGVSGASSAAQDTALAECGAAAFTTTR